MGFRKSNEVVHFFLVTMLTINRPALGEATILFDDLPTTNVTATGAIYVDKWFSLKRLGGPWLPWLLTEI